MIHVDATKASIVVWCDVCRVWSVLVSTRERGWAIARDHELRCHPGVDQAGRRTRDTPK